MKINPSACLERHILQNKITTVSDKKTSTIDIPVCFQLIGEVPGARKSAFIETATPVDESTDPGHIDFICG